MTKMTPKMIAARSNPYVGMRCYSLKDKLWWTILKVEDNKCIEAQCDDQLRHDDKLHPERYSESPLRLTVNPTAWHLPGEPECPPDPKKSETMTKDLK